MRAVTGNLVSLKLTPYVTVAERKRGPELVQAPWGAMLMSRSTRGWHLITIVFKHIAIASRQCLALSVSWYTCTSNIACTIEKHIITCGMTSNSTAKGIAQTHSRALPTPPGLSSNV